MVKQDSIAPDYSIKVNARESRSALKSRLKNL
jgi:hypothetical protein